MTRTCPTYLSLFINHLMRVFFIMVVKSYIFLLIHQKNSEKIMFLLDIYRNVNPQLGKKNCSKRIVLNHIHTLCAVICGQTVWRTDLSMSIGATDLYNFKCKKDSLLHIFYRQLFYLILKFLCLFYFVCIFSRSRDLVQD